MWAHARTKINQATQTWNALLMSKDIGIFYEVCGWRGLADKSTTEGELFDSIFALNIADCDDSPAFWISVGHYPPASPLMTLAFANQASEDSRPRIGFTLLMFSSAVVTETRFDWVDRVDICQTQYTSYTTLQVPLLSGALLLVQWGSSTTYYCALQIMRRIR